MSHNHHCVYCFNVLICHLEGKSIPKFNQELEDQESPMFVSWKSDQGSLRGCLGTFEPRPLGSGLAYYSIASATEDRRFTPIEATELSTLNVSVSLLREFEVVRDYRDWRIGIHGIILEFEESKKKYKATFLPEIAKEQGWDHDETINALIKKSGFNGKITKDLKEKSRITRYQSLKNSLSFAEYEAITLSLRGEEGKRHYYT